jgi:hypothetical protein
MNLREWREALSQFAGERGGLSPSFATALLVLSCDGEDETPRDSFLFRRSLPMSVTSHGRWSVALVAVLAACSGGRSDATPSTDTARASAPPAISGPAAAAEAPFAFTDADLDAYEKGMRKEIELVKAAKARGDSAKTPQERGAASQAAFETSTAPAAAQAIGVPADRYQATRRTVNRVFETLDFQGKIPGPMEIDTARASPDMKKRLAGDPLEELPPASAAALRARLDGLSKVWIEYTKLVAVNG